MKSLIKQLFGGVKQTQEKIIDAKPCGLKYTLIPENYRNIQWDIDKAASVKIYI
jgi:hypothetical protein